MAELGLQDDRVFRSTGWFERSYVWINRLYPVAVLLGIGIAADADFAQETVLAIVAATAVTDITYLARVNIRRRTIIIVIGLIVVCCAALILSLFDYYNTIGGSEGGWVQWVMAPATYSLVALTVIKSVAIECAMRGTDLLSFISGGTRVPAAAAVWRYADDASLRRAVSYKRLTTAQCFERRALQMRVRSLVVLSLIVLLIIGGVVSIFFAGNIVSTDAKGLSQLDQTTALISSYEEKISGLNDRLTSDQGDLARNLSELRSLGFKVNADTEFVVEAEPTGLSSDERKLATDLVEKGAELMSSITRNKDRFKDLADTLTAIELDMRTNLKSYTDQEASNETDVSLLVASGITRFGVLFVVIFLVQILLGVYRYSMRLATFYHSRADGLLLMSQNAKDLGVWGEQLLPKSVDFGRLPSSPSDYWAAMWRDFFASGKARGSAATGDGTSGA